jgi:hypothetical protein
MRTEFGSDTAVGRRAVDELLESYLSWREECHAVRLAYERWVDSAQAERRLRYAGYVTALDREDQAAGIYADRVERRRRISDQSEIASTAA